MMIAPYEDAKDDAAAKASQDQFFWMVKGLYAQATSMNMTMTCNAEMYATMGFAMDQVAMDQVTSLAGTDATGSATGYTCCTCKNGVANNPTTLHPLPNSEQHTGNYELINNVYPIRKSTGAIERSCTIMQSKPVSLTCTELLEPNLMTPRTKLPHCVPGAPIRKSQHSKRRRRLSFGTMRKSLFTSTA